MYRVQNYISIEKNSMKHVFENAESCVFLWKKQDSKPNFGCFNLFFCYMICESWMELTNSFMNRNSQCSGIFSLSKFANFKLRILEIRLGFESSNLSRGFESFRGFEFFSWFGIFPLVWYHSKILHTRRRYIKFAHYKV